MNYIALLRGINVGGHLKIEMPRLQQVFETAGCQAVQTYINSGNVIFADRRPRALILETLQTAIKVEFGVSVPIVLRDESNFTMLCHKVPPEWTNDSLQKTDVMFLWDEIDDPDVMDKVIINPEFEKIRYIPGALVWNVGRENVKAGSSIKLTKPELYKLMTVRNINTVRQLNERL